MRRTSMTRDAMFGVADRYGTGIVKGQVEECGERSGRTGSPAMPGGFSTGRLRGAVLSPGVFGRIIPGIEVDPVRIDACQIRVG